MRTVHSDRQLSVNEFMTMFALPPAPPVSPLVVVRPFAPAPHNWLPAHRGVDLEARRGQAVVAPRPGRIVFADRIAARPVLVLKSGVVRFTFEPVRARVTVGNDCSLVRCSAGSRPEAIATAAACTGVRRSMASTSIRCPSCHAPARF